MTTWAADLPGVLRLPSGLTVRGHGLRRGEPSGPAPEMTLVLSARHPADAPGAGWWVDWPDFRPPRSTDRALPILREVYRRAATERVLVTCDGGIGRTGTALAALVVLDGLGPDEAVGYVRAHYHRRAVDTPWQRRWLRRCADPLRSSDAQ